jgi:peptide deformylase
MSSQKLHFVRCDDPILETSSRPLRPEEIKESKIQRLCDEMLAFARGEQKELQKSVLVGLAAPQIGKNLRIILVDIQADGKGSVSELRVYINPEIVASSEEREEWYEGCYSTGKVKGIVSRPKKITVKAFTREGIEVQETFSGYVARIFQHEIDHLNGIRFPDRLSDIKALHLVQPDEMHAYRNQEHWRNWHATIPRESWKHYI